MALSILQTTSSVADYLNGVNLASDVYKCALFTSSWTPHGATVTAYSATNEVATATGYAAGGVALSGLSVAVVNGKTVLTWANIVWTTATIALARYALIYNSTKAGKNSIFIIDLGGNQSTVAGTFTIAMPVADDVTGLYVQATAA